MPPASRRILIVDDDIEILDALAMFLERRLPNVRVLSAESGPIALERLATAPVDLLVTDYHMPEMDGLSLIGKARERVPGLPAILMTGKGDVKMAARAINEQHIEYFFTKPLDHERLAVGVAEALWERQKGEIRDEMIRRAEEIARSATRS